MTSSGISKMVEQKSDLPKRRRRRISTDENVVEGSTDVGVDVYEDDSSSTIINNSMDSDSSPRLKPLGRDARPILENDLQTEINVVASPIAHIGRSTISSQEQKLKYFTFGAIILPSMIGVILPSEYWNDAVKPKSSKADFAHIITNGVTVFLIGWIIKFIIEWPWDWFNQLKAAKIRLIENMNSTVLVDHEFVLPSESKKFKVVKKILLLKKLIQLERIALLTCTLSSFLGSILMYAAKRVIIVNFEDEFRRAIVFNSANILLFQCWLLFRLALTISKDFSLRHPEEDVDEFGLNEGNLALFLSDKGSVWDDFVSKLPRPSTVEAVPADLDKSNVDTICSYLEQASLKQKHLIKKMVHVQNHKMKDLSNNLLKIEDRLEKLKLNPITPFLASPTTEYATPYTQTPFGAGPPFNSTPINNNTSPRSIKTAPSSPTNAVYVKPFPLNYSPEEKKLKFAATSTMRMNTILEEDDDGYNLSSPILFASNSAGATPSAYLDPPAVPQRLHNYDDDERERTMKEFNRTMTASFLVEVKFLVLAIFNKLSLQVVTHPTQLWKLVSNELNPRLLKLSKENGVAYNETSMIVKLLVWELLSAYVFKSFVPFDELFGKFDTLLIPFKRLKDLIILVSLKIPFNVFRFFLTIVLFLPKISFKIFFLYPFLLFKNKLDPSHERLRIFYPIDKSIDLFTGMKLFHLQSQQEKIEKPLPKPTSNSKFVPNEPYERFQTGGGAMKTRAAVIHNLSKHFDLDTGELFPLRMLPVELS